MADEGTQDMPGYEPTGRVLVHQSQLDAIAEAWNATMQSTAYKHHGKYRPNTLTVTVSQLNAVAATLRAIGVPLEGGE
jgi:hypothetical protein